MAGMTGMVLPPPDSVDSPPAACARTVPVADSAGLGAALVAAKAGDCITLADGPYTFPIISAQGSASAPIVIKAANLLKAVVSTGDLVMQGAAYVTVEGLLWNGPGVITVADTDHGRISRFRMQRQETGTDWVTITGKSSHCRIDHNDFGPQDKVGNMVIVSGPHEETGVGFMAQHTRIDHNHFHDIHFSGGNGWESIRSGVDVLAFQSSFSLIEHNLFINDANDPEVISLKSSDNVVRYNTLRKSAGQFVLRGGNGDYIYGNYVLGEGEAGAKGLRVHGGRHKIFGNYIEGAGAYGILLEGGTSVDGSGAINEHKQIYKTEVVFNTIVNSGGIQVGGAHPLDPVDCVIAYNLVQGPGALYRMTASSKNVTFTGNFGNAGTSAVNNGVRMVDPQLMKIDGAFTITAGSPAVNAGMATFPYVTGDILGKPRNDTAPDVGANEVNPAPAKWRGPLTATDVGPMAP
jgi:poly(beta-D-mannuronate) lyase